MSSDQIKSLLTTIFSDANSVASFAGVIDPALVPIIAIGKAVDMQIPGLVAGIAAWIGGTPPTQAELDDLAAKLAVLGNPNLP